MRGAGFHKEDKKAFKLIKDGEGKTMYGRHTFNTKRSSVNLVKVVSVVN